MNQTLEPALPASDAPAAPLGDTTESALDSRSSIDHERPETTVAEPSQARVLLLLEDIKRQVDLQPGQLRKLQRRIEEASIGLGEKRYEALIERLIGYLDLVERAEREFEAGPQERQIGLAAGLFASLRVELLQLLDLNDVRRSNDADGDRFEPQKHACIDTVITPQAERDGCIAWIQRHGYTFGPRCLRHSQVIVYKYQHAPLSTEDAECSPFPNNVESPAESSRSR